MALNNNIAQSPQQQLFLPSLRQDLSITSSAPGEDGGLCWVLYDPLINKYYRIGQIAFTLISSWINGASADNWLEQVQQKNPSINETDLEEIIQFFMSNGLSAPSDPQSQLHTKRRYDAANRKKSWLSRLFLQYLYIRIPLVNPDHFLGATLGYVTIFFHPFVRWFIRILGIVGIVLISRQWEEFSGSISHFFTVQGAVYFGFSLVFVKTLHELGHAYTAKRQGCRVSSMGIALMVLYPMLYTDTTDAWRLPSSKQRLAIATAGVKTELAVSFIACFCWSFLDSGILRSLMFFIATTSLMVSLGINMMPFMRFDGYYALSDILGADNLQPRAFALGKWKLREILFGLSNPPPEALAPQRRTIFILYAYATWVYRFMLFLGIALMVYHFAFKALGLLFFIVQLYYFIGRPIISEISEWTKNQRGRSINYRIVLTTASFLLLFTSLFTPWQNNIFLPAVLEVDEKTEVYSGENGIIRSIKVEEGQEVQQGQVLFDLVMPELEKDGAILNRKAVYLQTRLDRHVGSAKDLQQLDVLQKELARVQTDLSGINERMDQGVIHAPSAGHITRLTQAFPGQWVSQKTLLAQITGKSWTHITAYLHEDTLHRVQEGSEALFYRNYGETAPIPAEIVKISATSIATLPHPEMSSVHGGPIAVRKISNSYYRPESSFYRVTLKTQENVEDVFWRTAGHVRVQAMAESPIVRLGRYALSVLIRESGA